MGPKSNSPIDLVQKKLLFRDLYAMINEDLGFGDITTSALISPSQIAEARILSRESGIVAGIEIIAAFLEDLGVFLNSFVTDGTLVKANDTVLHGRGLATIFLNVERTILNLLQRMSGIATMTSKMVKKAHKVNSHVRIAATRKTAPHLRLYDKLAVIAGGGDPHRWRLDDAVLIKDNHLVFIKNVQDAIRKARQQASFNCLIEVEVTSQKMAIDAAKSGVDAILLDNFSPALASSTVQAIKELKLNHSPLIEVSGNITLDNIEDFAATGVDVISSGALTHSVTALDLTLDLKPLSGRKTKGS